MHETKSLNQKKLYRFFLPYKDNQDQDIPENLRDAFVKEIKLRCCETNRGFTIYEGQGGWQNTDGEIIEEPITILETYGKNPLPSIYWEHYASFLKQECLLGVSGVYFTNILFKSGVDLSLYKNTKVLKIEGGQVKPYREEKEKS